MCSCRIQFDTVDRGGIKITRGHACRQRGLFDVGRPMSQCAEEAGISFVIPLGLKLRPTVKDEILQF